MWAFPKHNCPVLELADKGRNEGAEGRGTLNLNFFENEKHCLFFECLE